MLIFLNKTTKIHLDVFMAVGKLLKYVKSKEGLEWCLERRQFLCVHCNPEEKTVHFLIFKGTVSRDF
jgi:hypothetical protein